MSTYQQTSALNDCGVNSKSMCIQVMYVGTDFVIISIMPYCVGLCINKYKGAFDSDWNTGTNWAYFKVSIVVN